MTATGAPADAPPWKPLLSSADIAARVAALATRIEADHPDGVVLVGVLKGALIFLADLARAIRRVPIEVDFIAISRYAPDSGRVRILKDLEADVAGRDVIVVEDIVDTGLTLSYLIRQLESRAPRRVDVCTLLDRPVRRIVPLDVRYRGEEIDDVFVLGYGLHHADLFRNLGDVVEADRRALRRDPGALVTALYGRARGDRDGRRDGRVQR